MDTLVTPRARPQTLASETYRVRSGHGNLYITVGLDEDKRPFEVFATSGKPGGCHYAYMEGIGRLVSLALRSNVELHEIVRQLRGITCCPNWDKDMGGSGKGVQIQSGADAIAHVLAVYDAEKEETQKEQGADDPGMGVAV